MNFDMLIWCEVRRTYGSLNHDELLEAIYNLERELIVVEKLTMKKPVDIEILDGVK